MSRCLLLGSRELDQVHRSACPQGSHLCAKTESSDKSFNATDPELQEGMHCMDSEQQQHVLKAAFPAKGEAHLTPASEAAVLSQSASFDCGSTAPIERMRVFP